MISDTHVNVDYKIGKYQFRRDDNGQLWRRKIPTGWAYNGEWEKVNG